jgi:hypothetical protein
VSYQSAQWDELKVHRRELEIVAQLKASQASSEDLATRLQVELQALDRQEYRAGIWHHLSLAFLISFITILAVEFHTRSRMRRDLQIHLEKVQHNVWEALGKRLLGPRIATEVEAVMKEYAAKEKCAYVVTFKPPQPGIPPDRVVVLIENSFKVRNLSGTPGRTHRIRASISNYEKIDRFPRFTAFQINGKDELSSSADPNRPLYYEKTTILPEGLHERIEVLLSMEIVYNIRDSESFITEVPMEGLQVTVVNQTPDRIGFVGFELFHRCESAQHPIEGTWHFDGALIPGQGFALNWREKA